MFLTVPFPGLPAALAPVVYEAQEAERAGRFADARERYDAALRRLDRPEHGPAAAALVRRIAATHLHEGDTEAALDCCEAALGIAEAIGDRSAAAHAVNAMAIVHWQKRQLDEAERLYGDALRRAHGAGELGLCAMIEQNLGVIANVRGDLDAALRLYESSLRGYRASGMDASIVPVLNNLGLLYTDLERWDDAERTYDDAVTVCHQTRDPRSRVLVEVNRARLWIARSEFGRARQACIVAYEFAAHPNAEFALPLVDKHFGVIARELGDLGEAEERLLRAHREAEARQDLLLAAEAARELAELYWRQERSRETLQYLNAAHRLFGQLRARRDLADVDRRIGRLEHTFLEIVARWSRSIESADAYTRGHCDRVTEYACALAERAGLDQQALLWFRMGALLHDVGKIVVPIEILNKPGKLTDEEFEVMKSHSAAGEEMLRDIDFPWDVKKMVRSHHEQWSGGGYPDGLAGEAIPFAARILTIADVYDALTTDRPYRRGFSHERAMSIMTQDAGRIFDPALFTLFAELCAERTSWPIPSIGPEPIVAAQVVPMPLPAPAAPAAPAVPLAKSA